MKGNLLKPSFITTSILLIVSAVTGCLALGMIFWYAPVEKTMGLAQKIFYIHVPCAWVTFLAFFIVFISSVAYLIGRRPFWDECAEAAAEIGVIFCTIVIITGPIWGRKAWGIWWTWDARLTTTLLLWVLYITYLMLRHTFASTQGAKTLIAILGIIAFLDVPIIHISIVKWRSLHPGAVVLTSKGFGAGLEPEMLNTLLVSLLFFTLLSISIFIYRKGLGRIENELAFWQKQVAGLEQRKKEV